MNAKTPVLFALLVPGLISLAACDRADNAVDDAATPVVEATPEDSPDAAAPPPDAMPADPMATSGTEIADSGLTFAQMDANSDGGVSMDELSTEEMLHAHFGVADADGDGSLSEAEITAHRAEMAADEPRN